MDARRLLIADSNEDFRMALAHALGPGYHLTCCDTGRQALEILRKEEFDLLVTDLILSELDGVGLLAASQMEGVCPTVLVISALHGNYVEERLSRMEIGYYIRKPCDIQSVIQRIDELCCGDAAPVRDPRAFLCDILLSLGFFPKHDGYRYLPDAILEKLKDPRQSYTKELYPAVAVIHGCDSGGQVERSIRSALDAAWKRHDPNAWERYFVPREERPSNGEFISRLAEILRLRQDGPMPPLPGQE